MIVININKAKNIAHEKRRMARAAEFTPLDIKATISSQATVAEADRQIIRDKYAEIQIGINSSTTIDEIKNEMDKFSDKLNGI
jgi:hypothetical protein